MRREKVTATAIPTLTPTAIAIPTHTPTAIAIPTHSPTVAVTNSPTTIPTFTPRGVIPDGRFKDIWQGLDAGDSRLGYPISQEFSNRDFVIQRFEKGVMYWWDNPDNRDYIWVIDSPAADFKSGQKSTQFTDEWNGQQYNCEAAPDNGDKGPKGGFGWLWCHQQELQRRLGNPREAEVKYNGSHVQFFQGGVMLCDPINHEVYVLFTRGDWQMFPW